MPTEVFFIAVVCECIHGVLVGIYSCRAEKSEVRLRRSSAIVYRSRRLSFDWNYVCLYSDCRIGLDWILLCFIFIQKELVCIGCLSYDSPVA